MRLQAFGIGLIAAGALTGIFSAAPARADDNPIVIGAAIALSGPIAPYDEGPYKAMQVAIDEVNAKGGVLGRPLKLISSDTKSDIAYGATAAQDVIDKGATLVVVTCDYDYGSAAANVANSKNLIAFSTCAGDPKFGAAGINQPLLGSEDWDGDFWIEAIPGLTGLYFDTYASVFGTDPRPEMQAFLKKFNAKFSNRPITSHAVTGYSVIEAWTRAVQKA